MTAFNDHMKTGCTTVSRAWHLKRNDGLVLGFTDHDRPITVEGVECLASSGMTAGALQTSTGMAVDNSEARGALSHDAIREEDIRAGLWDSAEVTNYLVNWAEPEDFEIVFRGSLGEISWGGGEFTAELRGLSENLNKVRGRVFQPRCDASLSDSRCQKTLGPLYVTETTVISVDDGQSICISNLDEFSPNWFEGGRLIALSGDAEGAEGRIKADISFREGRKLKLWESLRRTVKGGDKIRIEAGCNKTIKCCQTKFGNVHNFRGFPHIPGEDWLMSYPVSGGNNTGGKR